MLNKNFRYVSLDLETTGLDKKKDEVIQVGLVEIDINWSVIKQFQSFVKPEKKIEDLKTLVAYITWISIDDISPAPKINDLQNNIKEFFGENVVLVWHNIQFDIDFIKRYLPDLEFYDSIDTFYLSQNLVHFAPSYALDVLVEHLMSKDSFVKILENIHDEKININNSHNALFDAKNSLSLFFYFISDIAFLIKEYPVLYNFLSKNVWLYNKILSLKVDRAGKKNQNLSLPSLKKQLPADVSVKSKDEINLDKLKNTERFFVWNLGFSKLLSGFVSWNKNVVLSFSSVPKLNIAKNILNDLGLKNIWFYRWQTAINQVKFRNFLNKNTYWDNEFLFIIKYMSHVRHDISFLEFNTKFDYKIKYYLEDIKKSKKYPFVLTTHWWLFGIMKDDDHIYNNYDICFFDTEMRYNSYNRFLSNFFDLYNVLSFLESLYYKYTLDSLDQAREVLDSFARFFEIFMGVLFSETKQYFTNTSENVVVINPILWNINFYETNNLLAHFEKHKSLLENVLEEKDFDKLWSKIDNFYTIIWWLLEAKKVLYNQSEFYFVFWEASKFTNWDEFVDKFKTKVYFLSNFDKSKQKLVEKDSFEPKLNFKKISDIDGVVQFVQNSLDQKNKNIFVISTIKSQSKEIFDKMYNMWLSKDAELLVENITWSLWKNIFKAKWKWSKIIVWWYNFMMRFLSNNISIDICVDFNIRWKMSKYLLYDLSWYWNVD